MVSTRGSLRLLQREKPQLTLPLPGISSQRFGAARQCFRGFQRGRRRAASRWRDAAGAWLVEGAGLWRGGRRGAAVDPCFHPARALVPPPRPRAKRGAFSAPLQTTQRGQGSGLEAGYGARQKPAIPCTERAFTGYGVHPASRGWSGAIFRKSNFSNLRANRPWRPRRPWVLTLQTEVT